MTARCDKRIICNTSDESRMTARKSNVFAFTYTFILSQLHSQFTRLNCCVTKNIKRIKNIWMNGHHCIILSSKYSNRSSYFSSTKMCMQICFLPDVSLHITSPHLFNLRCNHNESMYSHSMLLLLLLWRIQQAHKAAYIKTTSASLFDEEWTNRILTSERGWCCSQYLRDTRVVVCCRSI